MFFEAFFEHLEHVNAFGAFLDNLKHFGAVGKDLDVFFWSI